MNYPNILKKLIDCYKKLPGVGEKSAERMALATLDFDQEVLNSFSDSILNIKSKLKRCKICNNYSEEDLCEICKSNNRDIATICVVEEPKNIILFEKVGTYNGMYHVLGGLISPLDGINPDQINIDSLLKRIKKGDIKEVIFALKPSIEGETTTLYIRKLLENTDVIISKIAHGIPMGADIDYIDSLTLELALEDRKTINIKE
jgi:recombination protein RecR